MSSREREEIDADRQAERVGAARERGDARASVPSAPTAASRGSRPARSCSPAVACGAPAAAEDADPTADLYPVPRNPRYQLDRRIPELSDEKLVTTYNNFYEFGSHKQIWKAAQALKLRPWTVTLDGMVEREQTLDIDDLLRQMPLEERVYRHRCVEAWSMAVPWSGFPLRALVDLAQPLGSAQYLRMETFLDPEMASGQKQFWYPWPYVEGLTMRRGDQRARLHRHRPVRQADRAAERRAAAPRGAVEIRLQIDQIDRPLHLHRRAPEELLGRDPGHRVRLLGERQPRGAASALEPGRGDAARQLDQGADRCCSTATASSSPTCTRGWRASRCSCDGVQELAGARIQ